MGIAMAGNNQAVNLGGMLSQIGSAVGSMGQTAGEAFGKTITNMTKPTVDTKDPQSVRQYANWLQSQGDEAGAMRYLQMADKLDSENKTMAAMTSSQEANEKAALGAQQGDVRYVQEQINLTRENLKRAATEKDVDGVRVYQSQLQQLNQMLPGAQEASATKKVSGALGLEKLLKAGERQDSITGEMVPLTPEQMGGVQKQFDTMMEDPTTRKAYTAAKVQEDQWRMMQQEQKDEQLIAVGSSAIFQAESVEDVEAAVAKSLEDPNLSPKARQQILQTGNARTTSIDRATARQERVTELNTPVVTKEDIDRMNETINALGADSPEAKQLRSAFDGVIKAQETVNAGGAGYATMAARQLQAKRYAQIEANAMNLASNLGAEQRRIEGDKNRRNAAAYKEAEIKAALGPSEAEVIRLVKASEDINEDLTYEEAKAKLQSALNGEVERIRPLVAPEEQARMDAERSANKEAAMSKPMPSGVSEDQAKLLVILRTNNPNLDDATLIAAVGEKWEQASGKKGGGAKPFGALSDERNTGRLGSFLGDMIENIGTVRTTPTPAEAAEQERFRNR